MGGLDRLSDGLMYKDLAGRRRLRRYVLAAIVIFALIGGIVLMGWRQRGQLLAQDVGIPAPAVATNQLAGESPTPAAAGIPLAEPLPSFNKDIVTATEFSSTQPAVTKECPDDPNAWELLEIAQSDNFKRIAPPCVYDGLARTVAWDLLRVLGYSAPEAAEMLGFASFPWRPVPEIIAMTNTQGPMPIALANPSPEEIKQAGNPDFHAWIIDQEGRSGAIFTLRGCYRTETVKGDRLERWEVAYPVICIVAMDQGEMGCSGTGFPPVCSRVAFNSPVLHVRIHRRRAVGFHRLPERAVCRDPAAWIRASRAAPINHGSWGRLFKTGNLSLGCMDWLPGMQPGWKRPLA